MTRDDGYSSKKDMRGTKKRAVLSEHGARRIAASALMCAFILFLLLKDPSVATASVKSGLSLCVTSLIPSLFPFMIISELAVRSGLASYPARLMERPTRRLFGLSGEAGCAFLIGTLCGFPIGARMGMSLYERGELTKKELTRLICVSSNAGLAFTVMTFGRDRLGSVKIGILLYLTMVMSSVLVGVLAKRLFPTSPQSGHTEDTPLNIRTPTPSVAALFTDAVKSSSLASLYVSGFVTFFTTVSGSLAAIFEASASLPSGFAPLVFGALELTGGLFSADTSLPPSVLLPMCGMMLGFSGLSVHFQILSVCDTKDGEGVRYLPLLVAKLASAAICGALLLALSRFFR